MLCMCAYDTYRVNRQIALMQSTPNRLSGAQVSKTVSATSSTWPKRPSLVSRWWWWRVYNRAKWLGVVVKPCGSQVIVIQAYIANIAWSVIKVYFSLSLFLLATPKVNIPISHSIVSIPYHTHTHIYLYIYVPVSIVSHLYTWTLSGNT